MARVGLRGEVRKQRFDVDAAVELVRDAVAPFPKAALFELAADGFDSLFEVLIACVISIRTRDETTVPTARALLARARTPEKLLRLSESQIDRLIHVCTFHR